MALFLIVSTLIGISMIGLGVGIFFFGKSAVKGDCSALPPEVETGCRSQEMGLCPVEDKTGIMRLATRSRLTYHPKEATDSKD